MRATWAVLCVLLALVLGFTAPSPAQRGAPPPFPSASPVIGRFHEDPRPERLDGFLAGLANKPMDWGDYPVLVGFFAATFQRQPAWMARLLPPQFDAKTADTIAAALRLSGRPAPPPLAVQLSQAGHDSTLATELANLPPRLEELRPSTMTHVDILWGAYFATGDPRHVQPILDAFAVIANRSDALAIDIAKVTAAMAGGPRDVFEQAKAKYDQATLWSIVMAATMQSGLMANAQNFAAVKSLLQGYVGAHPQSPADKSLGAFLKSI